MSKFLRPPYREGTLRLPGGRTLGWAEFGDRDGPPAFYFHGFPNCRVEPGLVPLSGVRLIAVDRPGFGRSSSRPGRRLLDWPEDVAALADHLGIGRFSLVGLSGGAPYAAACAARLHDRVEATGLVSGLAPMGTGWEGRSRAGRMLGLGRRPKLARLVAGGISRAIMAGRVEVTARLMMRVLRMPRPDREALAGDRAGALLSCTREAQGSGIEGALQDMAIYAADWGFSLGDVRGPVRVWHGAEDELVPPAAGRVLAASIPRAELRVVPGEGHFSLIIRRHEEILKNILAARETI